MRRSQSLERSAAVHQQLRLQQMLQLQVGSSSSRTRADRVAAVAVARRVAGGKPRADPKISPLEQSQVKSVQSLVPAVSSLVNWQWQQQPQQDSLAFAGHVVAVAERIAYLTAGQLPIVCRRAFWPPPQATWGSKTGCPNLQRELVKVVFSYIRITIYSQ